MATKANCAIFLPIHRVMKPVDIGETLPSEMSDSISSSIPGYQEELIN